MLSSRKSVLIVSGVGAVLVVVVIKALFGQGLQPVPITVHAVQRHYDGSGKQVGSETMTKAVRNDASNVWVRETMDGRNVGIRAIIEVPKRTRTVVDPITESTTTYHLTPTDVKQTDCAKWYPGLSSGSALLGREQILGREVLHVKVDTRTRNNGQDGIYRESWIAPALGCIALKEVTSMYDQAKVKAYQVTEVESIKEGEPDAKLFNIPGNYTERPPSAVFQENARRTGRVCPSCERNTGARLDSIYIGSQK